MHYSRTDYAITDNSAADYAISNYCSSDYAITDNSAADYMPAM